MMTNSCTVYSSGRQIEFAGNNHFVIADFDDYILMDSRFFSISVHFCSFSAGIFSVASPAATDDRKRALLPLIKGMEWLQMGLCCVLCVVSCTQPSGGCMAVVVVAVAVAAA